MMIELVGPAGEVVYAFFDEKNPNHKNPVRVAYEQDNPHSEGLRGCIVPNNMVYAVALNPIDGMNHFHGQGYRAVSEEGDWLETGEWIPSIFAEEEVQKV